MNRDFRQSICAVAGVDHLVAAREALQTGSWVETKASVEIALQDRETPEALMGLAEASVWLGEATITVDALERAFRLFRERGSDEEAARASVMLAEWPR